MNSHYDLSLEEQKLILTLASMVQPEDEDFKSYKFRIADFMKLLGVENKSKYVVIPKITKELMKKVFEIEEGKKLIQTAWLSGAMYEKGTGYVELTFSSYLKPYMLKLNNMFTQYKLSNILSMKSKYSPRLYEILKCNEFKKQGYIEIKVEELRKLLKVDNRYPLYADFKRRVIEQGQKELKKMSDINFEFEEIRLGRKITSLKIYIHTNKSIDKAKEPTFLPTAENEVSATIEEPEKETPIKKVMSIMSDSKITALEAKKIYDSSKKNLETIKKVYDDGKNKDIPNFIGWMISMVKPGVYIEPKKNYAKGAFNNYEQRAYDGSDGGMDFDELEKKLLSLG